MPEDQIKIAFSKVKQDIQTIADEIKDLKRETNENKEKINEVISKINDLKESLKKPETDSSIGNDGVNQSINHLINQSINHQSINQSFDHLKEERSLKWPSTPSIEVDHPSSNQSFDQSINHQSINHLINQSDTQLKGVTEGINKVFLSFSKQELKIFLTIYQLEDEEVDVSYYKLSLKMQLSEHCIRGHMSSLLRKNAPIIKKRLNNHTNLLSISKEFRALNLKQKLINLFYESDPHQKTLFDIN